MGSDDYAAVGGGGALKLKGAKIHKKKKKRDKTDLEKNLDTGNKDEEKRMKKKSENGEEQEPHDEDDEDKPEVQKTEAQKRHEEIKKKRAKSSSSRPELLKTHKERVEELNTYLSRLSEHHDMPRIGPG
ncbi:hypothetical protein FBULB1_430 [Fusarium bulbicola]|uniref:DUF1754-domain-containing protein n=1 Tax=Fusarium circinatum TaxID=48490 RepID=A0A8H5TV88_FUSCI|nr:hypothetical protein FCIRC_6213 [Fusarium circinatum]KAF5989918.1 hypothetical protein FBULB1_430 [Fusarium bulbicola]